MSMEAKWTKGPWLYRPDEYDDWGVVRTAPDAEGRMWRICQARDPAAWKDDVLSAHRHAGTDPWEANARLIAAAPDLAEALQEAVDQYGKPGGPWNVPSDPGGWLERARAALARAKGESA